MTERDKRLSDEEVMDLLCKAQKEYDQYLELPEPEAVEAPMPTYSASNPVGLVVNAVVD